MADLVQLHACEPITAARLRHDLGARIDARWCHRWARVEAAIAGPWRPADVWHGGPERLLWTASFRYPDGGFFTADGEAEAGRSSGLTRRQAPVHPAELVGSTFSAALVVWHSDAAQTVCVSLWRERQLRWSLRVDARERLVRCDGQKVVVEAPPRHLPEGDRAGVILAGLQRLCGEFPVIEGAERLVLVDTLEALTAAAPWQVVGEFAGRAPAGAVARAGG